MPKRDTRCPRQGTGAEDPGCRSGDPPLVMLSIMHCLHPGSCCWQESCRGNAGPRPPVSHCCSAARQGLEFFQSKAPRQGVPGLCAFVSTSPGSRTKPGLFLTGTPGRFSTGPSLASRSAAHRLWAAALTKPRLHARATEGRRARSWVHGKCVQALHPGWCPRSHLCSAVTRVSSSPPSLAPGVTAEASAQAARHSKLPVSTACAALCPRGPTRAVPTYSPSGPPPPGSRLCWPRSRLRATPPCHPGHLEGQTCAACKPQPLVLCLPLSAP